MDPMNVPAKSRGYPPVKTIYAEAL